MAKLPYGLTPEQIEKQIGTRALQCREQSLRDSIYMARSGAKKLADVIRSCKPMPGGDGLRESRELALQAFREFRLDCRIAVAALERRQIMLKGMAADFVGKGVVDSLESGLSYARKLVDHESELGFAAWRHGGWYVHGVRYPSGAVGCVSKNYPDGKWRIVCDSRRTELGGEGDYTFESRIMAARAEQELATAEWMEFVQNKGSAEEVGPEAERQRG